MVHRRRNRALSLAVLALGFLDAAPALAAVTPGGDTTVAANDNQATIVGKTGIGSLYIDGGSVLSDHHSSIGDDAGSVGTVTVIGAGSKWTSRTDLYVGRLGSGTLTVADGGTVSAMTLYASLGDLVGNGTISAAGWVLDNDVVFDSTHGTTQTLAFGSGGTLRLVISGTGDLGAGHKGNGSLTIADGMAITSYRGHLGSGAGSTGMAIVSGTGSIWINRYELNVGRSGAGTLDVESGGQVSSRNGYLGYDVGSNGTATVRGAGSQWINSEDLYVGRSGSGRLIVCDGGQVSANMLYASLSGLHGNGTITTNGAVLDADLVFDSTHGKTQPLAFGSGGVLNLAVAGRDLGVGYKGSGSLRIADGVVLGSSTGYLGYCAGSSGTATVSGTGTVWDSQDLYVGYNGSGRLTVTDGGHVRAGTLHAAMSDLHGNGTIIANGVVLDADLIFDNTHATNQTLSFGSGGTLNLAINSDRILGVGHRGNGSLRIADGVTVASRIGYLGHSRGSAGTATVSGAGSQWTSGEIYVGYGGSGTLSIEAGGQVNSFAGIVGVQDASRGTVTGAGSKWTSGCLYIGHSGSGTLRVCLISRFTRRLGSGTRPLYLWAPGD